MKLNLPKGYFKQNQDDEILMKKMKDGNILVEEDENLSLDPSKPRPKNVAKSQDLVRSRIADFEKSRPLKVGE